MTSPYRTAAPTPDPEPKEPLVASSGSQFLTSKTLDASACKHVNARPVSTWDCMPPINHWRCFDCDAKWTEEDAAYTKAENPQPKPGV